MLVADRPEFVRQMERAARVFGKDVDDQLLDDYWRALRDLSIGTVAARMDGAIQHGKYFPKPRDLRHNPDGERVTVSTMSPDTGVDPWTATINRVGLSVLLEPLGKRGQPGWSDRALEAMVVEIRRISAQMRDGGITGEDWVGMVDGVKERLRTVMREADGVAA